MVEAQGWTLLNSIFDFVMKNIRHNIATLEDYTVVNIPDLFKKKEACFLSTTVSASISASQGTLSDLTTLHRVGDVTITTHGDTFVLTAVIALDVLKVTFNHYTIQAALLSKSGNMLDIHVRKNAFDAKLTARLDGLDCAMTLDDIVVKEFDDVKVELTGFSVLNPIGSRVAEWFISFFNNFVKEVVEAYARNMVNSVIEDKELLSRLLGNAIYGVVTGGLEQTQSEPGRVDEPVAIQIPHTNNNLSDCHSPAVKGHLHGEHNPLFAEKPLTSNENCDCHQLDMRTLYHTGT